MEKTLSIAIAQLSIADGEKAANVKKMVETIKEAYAKGANLLIFPELMLTGLVAKADLKLVAEPCGGESFKQIQTMVAAFPISVVYSFPEYVSDDEVYITTCMMDQNGKALGYYRKTHLFEDENQLFSRGSEWTIVKRGNVSLGLLTCYDIEFPEPARALALQGVNLLIVTSANMAPYEYIHRLSIQARALENQYFVVYCNRLGANKWYDYHGESAVVAPNGKIIVEVEPDMEMVKVVELPLVEFTHSPSGFNYLKDRRPELYQSLF